MNKLFHSASDSAGLSHANKSKLAYNFQMFRSADKWITLLIFDMAQAFWTNLKRLLHSGSGSAALSHASSAHRCLHLMDCLGPGIWRHTTKVRAVSSVSSPSGRWMAPLAMLTKTPGIFIIHWLSIAAQRYQKRTFFFITKESCRNWTHLKVTAFS